MTWSMFPWNNIKSEYITHTQFDFYHCKTISSWIFIVFLRHIWCGTPCISAMSHVSYAVVSRYTDSKSILLVLTVIRKRWWSFCRFYTGFTGNNKNALIQDRDCWSHEAMKSNIAVFNCTFFLWCLAVFTRVARYVPWIKDIMAGGSGQNGKNCLISLFTFSERSECQYQELKLS